MARSPVAVSVVVTFLLLANVLVETGALRCPGVKIVSRKGWGARPPRLQVAMKTPRATHVFIHHTTGPQCNDKTSCSRLIRSHQKHHMDANRWPDIGYNFLVGGDGRIYEGRGFGREGAHTRGYNHVGIAISFVGDFNRAKPSQRMLRAAQRLISCGVRKLGHPWSNGSVAQREQGSKATVDPTCMGMWHCVPRCRS